MNAEAAVAASPYLATLPELGGAIVKSLAISPDEQLLAAGEQPSLDNSQQSSIQLWDVAQRKKITEFTGIGGIPSQVAFSPDGSTLAAVVLNLKGNLRFWNVATHRALPDPVRQRILVTAIAYSPDGRMLAVGGFCRNTAPASGFQRPSTWA